MTNLSDFKAIIRAGAYIEVTNHYITNPKHSRFGTLRYQIDETNGSAFYFHGERFPWPKVSQLLVEIGTDGGVDGKVWKILGGGASQGPGDLFLSIRVLRRAAS